MLPKFIVGLADDHGPSVRYERLDEASTNLSEKDYDELLVKNREIVADTLRQAGLIAADSTLKILGTQVMAIDVLMAEVDATGNEFRRLVLFEDKLLRNPESRRKVLGQILEYAENLEQADSESIKGTKDVDEWLDDVREEIEVSMREGDFLLVLCGDQPHERMVTLARRFAQMASADPLCLYDICTLSLAIYVHDEQRILVPNVVSAVAEAQRSLKIRIRDGRGEPYNRKAVVVQDKEGPRARSLARSEEEFFQENHQAWTPEKRDMWASAKSALQAADIAGLDFTNTHGGRPNIMLADTPVGDVKVFALVGNEALAADCLHVLVRKQLRNSEIGKTAIAEFREALLSFDGAATTQAGRVRVPVAALKKSAGAFIAAIKHFAAALDRC